MRMPGRRRRAAPAVPGREPLMLGTQAAQGAGTEAAHRAARPADERSPLAGVAYDRWTGDRDLARFRPSSTDDEVRRFIEASLADPSGLADRRAALPADDLYVLLFFTRRAGLLALRTGDHGWATAAAGALAHVAVERIDWRDLAVAAAVVAWALDQVGQDAAATLRAMASLADPATAELLEGRASSEAFTLAGWGLTRIDGPDGVGFVDSDHRRWHPTVDLLATTFHVAAAIEAVDGTRYLADQVTLASHLPDVWVADTVSPELGAARAVASVHAAARPGVPDGTSQMFVTWVLELADADAAARVAAAVRTGAEDHAALALHHGPLALVAIARSWVGDVASIEDDASLHRFAEPFAAALGGPFER